MIHKALQATWVALLVVFLSFSADVQAQSGTPDATLNIEFRSVSDGSIVSAGSTETVQVMCSNTSATYTANVNSTYLALVNVVGGSCYTCRAEGFNSYAQSGSFSICATSGSTSFGTMYFQALNGSLNVSLVDGYTYSPVTVGSADLVKIVCSDYTGTVSTSKSFVSGVNSLTMNVPDQTSLQCQFSDDSHLSGYSLQGQGYVYVSGSSSVNMTAYALDSNLTISLVDTAGEPYPVPAGSTAEAECQDYAGNKFDAAINVGESSVNLGLVGNSSYQCTVTGLNGAETQTNYVYIGSSESAATSITALITIASLTLNLQTSDGTMLQVPASASYAFAYCSGPDYLSKSLTAGAQQAAFNVYREGFYYCGAYIDGYSSGTGTFIEVTTGSAATANVQLVPLDATLAVNLVAANGGAAYAVEAGAYAYVNCYGSNGYFSYNIPANDSSTSGPIASGTYSCGAYLPGTFVTETEVEVASGSSATVSLPVTTRDYTINVTIKNPAGETINVDGSIYGYTTSSTVSDYIYDVVSGGTGSVDALDTTYALSFYANSYGSGNTNAGSSSYGLIQDNLGNSYLQSFDLTTVTVNGADISATITLSPADATLNISVTGASESSVWVNAFKVDGSGSSSVGAYTDGNGTISLPVAAGTYTVSAYGLGSALPPAPVQVTVASGGTESVSLAFQATDYTLRIAGAASDSATGNFSCFLTSGDFGFYNSSDLGELGGEVSVGLISAVSEWLVSCYGYGQDSAGNFTIYNSELSAYKVLSGASEDTINVTLNSAGNGISELFNLSVDAGGTVGFDAGEDLSGSLEFPPDAFNSADDTLTVSVSNTDPVLRGTDELVPLPGLAFDIDAEESDGDEVEINTGKTLVFTTEFEFPEDFDEESLKVMQYDTASGALVELETEEISDESSTGVGSSATIGKALKVALKKLINQKVVFVARAVTPSLPEEVAGITVKSKEKKAKASKKRKKNNSKYKITVNWEASVGADSYIIKIIDKSDNEELASTTATELEAVLNNLKLKNGSYTAEVSAVNALGETASATDFRIRNKVKRSRKRN